MPAAARPRARASDPAPGRRLLAFDRREAGKRGTGLVAGADEAGRGALAGPLVCAAVLFDLERLSHPGARRPLACLNDSKQLTHDERERLYLDVMAAASAVAVRVIPAARIDGDGLHVSNLAGLRACLTAVAAPGGLCLVDHYPLGPGAPAHTSLDHGDATSAAIAAASVVAKVTRDRLLHRLDAVYPAYGFRDHVGYITRAHEAAVIEHGPCSQHRLSFGARCYAR